MDLDYDHKFEEMKKYIPFLENMIKRLENTNSGSSNPRQAQLDKIRSLRDLLQDKKKRMKMENLLKCEQVLVNLYAKVEQRDTFSDMSEAKGSELPNTKGKSDLETVRNKLKCVTMLHVADADTLPEIARSSEMAEMCTPGSKEPALFQRRPNKVSGPLSSLPNSRDSTMISPSQPNSRRGYTRVLVSPERSSRRWTSNEPTSTNKLFSRRSPRRSPRRHSPSYHKKERKKVSKNIKQTIEKNDLNITLNVPEDSLNSLNTKDILTRIITCSNDDVDIKTLRELRAQILGELKQTGENDDISDLILKSYKTKKSRTKSQIEVEEGELSDSESEAIESIYGSLVVVDKDKSNIRIKNVSENDQSRKIQICLVINAKDINKTEEPVKENPNFFDGSDFELLNKSNSNIKGTVVELFEKAESVKVNVDCIKKQTKEKDTITQNEHDQNQKEDRCLEDTDFSSHSHNQEFLQTTNIKSNKGNESNEVENVIIDSEKNASGNKTDSGKNDKVGKQVQVKASLSDQTVENAIEPIPFKANFYKPLVSDEVIQIEPSYKDTMLTTEKKHEYSSQCITDSITPKPMTSKKNKEDVNAFREKREHKETDLELPFLNEPFITKRTIEKDVVSQIDILQALKNEILNESMDIPGSDTPPLHQPKIVKVASAQKIIPNRISIEKYKEKTASTPPLLVKESRFSNSKEDPGKKQSIKLTEKECERFNFTSNIELDDVNISSEDEEGKKSNTLDNLYEDLAPKSPDLDNSNDLLKTPIIIPAEPVKAIVVGSKADVDMRTFIPIVSKNVNSSSISNIVPQEIEQESLNNEKTLDKQEIYCDKSKIQLLDPRIRRDFIQPANIEQPTSHSTNADKIPRSMTYSNITTGVLTNLTQNITPSLMSLTPIITPLMAPIMTPNSRAYENTPTHQTFEVEDNNSNGKHVYAPSFPIFEFHNSVSMESNSHWDSETNCGNRKSRWEGTGDSNQHNIWEDSKMNRREMQESSFNDTYKNDKGSVIERYKIDRREENSRPDCPRTPLPSFGWADCSSSPNVFNRLDSPMTASNTFGRLECPTTPSHPFGRSECPLTPSHPFGRLDCSTAPHLLGRVDCPVTPNHPFGRLDCPPTPSHPFGQSECPPTPVYPFGRADCPLTPSHPFGRLEGSVTPSHTFGRTDYSPNTINRQISSKDPRLNKPFDHDQSHHSDERDRRYYRDRGFNRGNSYNSRKTPYNNSLQSYRKYDREQTIGRNDRNPYYYMEQSGRRFRQELRREPSVSHTTNECDTDRRYRERDGRYSYDNKSSYREKGARYERERSVGRKTSTEENYQSVASSQSVSGNNQSELNIDKTLSVKSHAGRSFTIDTSVNSTFQNFIQKNKIQIFDYTFDAHRKRASSVGRSLVRESSVGRTLLHHSKSKISNDTIDVKDKNSRYTRASSLGRDLSSLSNGKSFQEIKADFKNDKSKFDSMRFNNIADYDEGQNKQETKSTDGDNKSEYAPRSIKGIFELCIDERNSQFKTKQQYSPRNNSRDPRVRREVDNTTKNKYGDKEKSRDEKSSGIVYSSDNIAKGTILGSGYGVKNYKIPKIKRVTTEIEEKELKIEHKNENNESLKVTVAENDLEKNKIQSSNDVESNKIVENLSRRITRSSIKIVKTKSDDVEEVVKIRKVKKPLVYDSESESETTINEKEFEDNNSTLSQEAAETSQNLKVGKKDTQKKLELNAGFGLDDLDVFSDNIVSDPVIENINALIADLDNDIDTSKNDVIDEFTEDVTLESMWNSMKNSETLDQVDQNPLHVVNEVIKEDLDKKCDTENEIKEIKIIEAVESTISFSGKSYETADAFQAEIEINNDKSNVIQNVKTDNVCEDISSDKKKTENLENVSNLMLDSINNEPIVSTTHADLEYSDIVKENKFVTNTEERSNDGCSTPDSTINMDEDGLMKSESETVPDSTNEVKNAVKSDSTSEINTDVTSTDTFSDFNNTDNVDARSSRKEAPALHSIGSLLSMLQDKSKIKELVTMLGEKSGENEKIKKKLEKLSEIVSDDEDINDDVEIKTKDAVDIEIKENITAEIIGPIEKSIKESQTNEENTENTEVTNEDGQISEERINESKFDEKTITNNDVTVEHSNVSNECNTDTKSDEKLIDSKNEKPEHSKEETETYIVPEKVNKLEEYDKTKLVDNDTNPPTESEEILEENTPKTKKVIKRNKGKFIKTNKVNRITRTSTANLKSVKNTPKKKPSRELLKLQEDIKEMFLNDENLHATGIRMCRLVKMGGEKTVQKEDIPVLDPKPIVVLKKCKEMEKRDNNSTIEKPARKKPGPKPKSKNSDNVNVQQEYQNKVQATAKIKAASKNKGKITQKYTDLDPYAFESDSIDTNVVNESAEEAENSTDSESTSLISSQSFGSNELLADLTKKPKRKRRNTAWRTGVIRPKNKKKKIQAESSKENELLIPHADIVTPDMECFTDTLYCFQTNISVYSCRLCVYSGSEIVHHYKQNHPHVEIPLSRMNHMIAKEAIAQCKKIDFRVIEKIPTDKYVCRFCYKEFSKGRNVLETFFWHVVSMHTGEYKHTCSECVNTSNCPLNLDIPPPPKDMKGQLIGYICKKCNFTQISIENLKSHVIIRHNDEKTEVYKINLAVMPKKILKSLTKQEIVEPQRVTRSSLTNRQADDITEDQSDMSDNSDDSNNDASSVLELKDKSLEKQITNKPQKKYKIIFDTDNHVNEPPNSVTNELLGNVKQESQSDHNEIEVSQSYLENRVDSELTGIQNPPDKLETTQISPHISDIIACTHFKISYKSSGTKEYVCCINGQDDHYKTTLLISMKKHIQTKHTELWEGYCNICKVIVTPQGTYSFKECLQHMLDKHMDEFPLLENSIEIANCQMLADVEDALPKSYINVRPLAQLITNPSSPLSIDKPVSYPKIESVISFSVSNIEPPRSSPSYPIIKKKMQPEKQYKYEEWQVEVMSKKHRVVLETMMSPDKLIQVYKCAGRFCSFTTDNAEDALLHASTHQRIGGENALVCAYCDFDTSGNAIDLVMHVFKVHGRCQYSCALCFYRAAAGQLIGAHVERIHKEQPKLGSVLRTKTVSMPVTEDSSNLLSRQDAVEYYYCAHSLVESDQNDICKHRTYIADKFIEHLEIKHDAPHPCTMCSYTASNPTDLIEHMKSHKMNLYQCTWCVHGSDNDVDLMTHASIYHPTKQPNAYVRVITNKEHQSELRVLPMASFNKINTLIEDVISNIIDDPVREAERSLNLEKLIGDIETVNTPELVQSHILSEEPENITEYSTVVEPDQNLKEAHSENHSNTSSVLASSVQLPVGTDSNNTSQEATLVPKSEPLEQISTSDSTNVIYCSDSDDDESRPPVIDLSNEDTTVESFIPPPPPPPVETYNKISSALLHKCPKCKTVCRTMVGFKKHIIACWVNSLLKNYKCPHYPCRKMLPNLTEIVNHYIKDHKIENANSVLCSICNVSLSTLQKLKQHVKCIHKIDNYTVKTSTGPNGKTVNTVIIAKEKALPKRKLSAETAKQRRFGPKDVDKLPITPILDDLVYCSLCEFNTKVRLNLVRHLQFHAEQQPVSDTAPVNPVPHLETNEKHFDKMLNLASSSIATRGLDKVRSETSTSVSLLPPETASRYPKYVPERQRYTCGSKGCAYISLSEDMFRCHWETLHSNTTEYHCVHCPPIQQLNTKKPLTASLIIGHLKMHDVMLYACPSCPYYHYKRQIVESHLIEIHGGGQVVVVREDSTSTGPVPAPTTSAPTMDLKPWQCGLCRFKSMLRPEVAEHCSKVHQSKMQYKCTYCPFRTSTLENVTKHQTNSHPDKNQDVFYYYYREGSVLDDKDGIPLWVKQKQQTNAPEPEVKTEVPDLSTQTPAVSDAAATHRYSVDLNIVKQEMNDGDMESAEELSIVDLCKKYGQFCDPNGLKYKCSLCNVVVEDIKEAMQSHLYEELKYRRFSCGICSYKAFHINGLNEHMGSEHKREHQDPIKLPKNVNIEKWVTDYLEHQTNMIKNNEEKIGRQRLPICRVTAGPSRQKNQEPTRDVQTQPIQNVQAQPIQDVQTHGVAELECTFGEFGTPSNVQYSCPKCNFTDRDEDAMKQHLEYELAKIRWCCSLCSTHYQTYHQGQYHCKSVHQGQSARPTEAVRDPNVRAAWVSAVIESQKLLINSQTSRPDVEENITDNSENSLLVVRYEERVPTPEEMVRRNRSATDSDDDRLEIEPEVQKKGQLISCQYCKFTTKYSKTSRQHLYRHYDLKPYKCSECTFMGHRVTVVNHIEKYHPGMSVTIERTPMPKVPPKHVILGKRKPTPSPVSHLMMCLNCEKFVATSELDTHVHENQLPEFAKKGDIVVKCCICLALRLDVKSLQQHHNSNHPFIPINYSFYKMQIDTRYTIQCGHCKSHFRFLRDLKAHHNATHSSLPFVYTTSSATGSSSQEGPGLKRKSDAVSVLPWPKKVARKSTTKLPIFKAVAMKSTTKLPFTVESDDSDVEYSDYGKKPPPIDHFSEVTALMPFCGTIMRFTMKKLSEIIEIEPKVVVTDIKSDFREPKK